jgi:hypothetical protein
VTGSDLVTPRGEFRPIVCLARRLSWNDAADDSADRSRGGRVFNFEGDATVGQVVYCDHATLPAQISVSQLARRHRL